MHKNTDNREEKVSKYTQALFDALHEVKTEDQDVVLENFARALKENGDLELIEDIEKAFLDLSESIYKQHAEANQKELEKIKEFNEYLEGMKDMSGLGGAVFRIDDEE